MKFSVALIEYLSVLSTIVTASRTFIRDKGRIVSGQDANDGQFPYMVIVEPTIDGKPSLCGGSLIAPTWILTAAHCFDDTDSLLVYLGTTLLEDAKVAYEVPLDRVELYPEYDPEQLLNDIALIPIPETELCGLISTIALPSVQTDHQSYVGEHGLISGWGTTVTGGSGSDRMQWGQMLVVDNKVCREIDPLINIAELCAKPVDNASPCNGDSGGPLVTEYTLIGVVSNFLNDDATCEDGVPVIFARVSFYVEWIKAVTGIST